MPERPRRARDMTSSSHEPMTSPRTSALGRGGRGRRWARCCIAGMAFAWGICAGRSVAMGAEAPLEPALELAIERTRLDNGLRVVLSRDTTLPTVAICLVYGVGTRNEGEGERGFTRWVARSMARVAEGETSAGHPADITAHGGRATHAVGVDHTRFCTLLPQNALALGLWLESERMLYPRASPRAMPDTSASVAEEPLARPDSTTSPPLRLLELSFAGAPVYARALADGSGAPLEPPAPSSPEALRAFYETHYSPRNAVLCVAGDFDADRALSLIRRYFDAPGRDVAPPAPELPAIAEPAGAVAAAVPTDGAAIVETWSAWSIPPLATPARAALELAALIVGGGDASRLRQLLVYQEGVAQEVHVHTTDSVGPGVFAIGITPITGAEPVAIRRLVSGQLSLLSRFGPTPAELSRAKSQLRSAFFERVDGNLPRSAYLATFELLRGDAGSIPRELDRLLAPSGDDVRRSVARYLAPERESRFAVHPSAQLLTLGCGHDAEKPASGPREPALGVPARPPERSRFRGTRGRETRCSARGDHQRGDGGMHAVVRETSVAP